MIFKWSFFLGSCVLLTGYIDYLEVGTLTEKILGLYDLESFGAFKKINQRSTADGRALKILEGTSYHDGIRYQKRILLANNNPFPDNYSAALVQLNSLRKRLEKDEN